MNEKDTEMLAQAFLSLKSVKECEAFFADIFTQKEIEDLTVRLEVARLLSNGVNYIDIAARTGASTATISRVSKSLSVGDGYKTVLERLSGVEEDELSLEGLSLSQRAAIVKLVESMKK